MSFWPFGQSSGHSNINQILEDYFTLVNSLARSNPTVAEYLQEGYDNGEGVGPVLGSSMEVENPSSSTSLSAISSIRAINNIDKDRNIMLKRASQNDLSSLTIGSSISDLSSSIESYSSSSLSLPSRERVSDEDVTDVTVPLFEDISSLNESYIEKLLNETDLINELSGQDQNLLDFICLGFFFDRVSEKKVKNLQYLIDQLLYTIEKLSTVSTLTRLNTADDGYNSDIDIENIENADTNIDDDDYDEDNENNDNENNDLNEYSTKIAYSDESDSNSTNFIRSNSDTEEPNYLNRATIISELLSMDAWQLVESLVEDNSYIEKLWSILNQNYFNIEKSPLVPLFLKIQQNLLIMKQEQYLGFIVSKKTLVDDILGHVEISPLMDFFLQCISTDKCDTPTGVLQALYEQQLVDKCLKFLEDTKIPSDIKVCSGDLLKGLIAISANTPAHDMNIGPNILTREMVSNECVDRMIGIIVNNRGVALNTTVSIIIELIRKNNSDYDQINLLNATLEADEPTDRDPIYLGYMLKKFSMALPSIFQIILDIEDNSNIPLLVNQLGKSFKPLGFERFKIVELIAELLHCSNMGLMSFKKAERIAIKRDKYRGKMNISTNESDHSLSSKGDETIQGLNNDESSDESDDGIDESFEVPYISDEQNKKLRHNPTIGDLFKIKLHDTQILPKIMKLFLEYSLNNFWHNVIFDIIQQIFNGRMDFSYNSFLVYSLFDLDGSRKYMNTDTKNLSKIKHFQILKDFVLKGYQSSYNFYEKMKVNLGYMGHLVLIAEEVVKFSKLYKTELISDGIFQKLKNQDWIYYSEEVLNETRIMYSKVLGGKSYIEDENGYIVPHLPDQNGNVYDDTIPNVGTDAEEDLFSLTSGNSHNRSGLVNVEDSKDQLSMSTESDLHDKLKNMLISASQEEINSRNKKNGVIILGPPE